MIFSHFTISLSYWEMSKVWFLSNCSTRECLYVSKKRSWGRQVHFTWHLTSFILWFKIKCDRFSFSGESNQSCIETAYWKLFTSFEFAKTGFAAVLSTNVSRAIKNRELILKLYWHKSDSQIVQAQMYRSKNISWDLDELVFEKVRNRGENFNFCPFCNYCFQSYNIYCTTHLEHSNS